ncbi:hypothetical protein EK904_003172 [Melospiza melodia maxima]|nr:hypothetical protein EK904_003172 [Melospiza melodia maxima]
MGHLLFGQDHTCSKNKIILVAIVSEKELVKKNNAAYFLKQLGIHPDWQFVDVYGMEPELLSMVPRPYETFRTEEEERIKAKGQDVKSSVYFMKQTINNACGTIGLIHAIANNRDKMNFETNSSLKKFLEDSLSMTPEERAKYLETYEAIRVTHESSAHEGVEGSDKQHDLAAAEVTIGRSYEVVALSFGVS